MRNPNTDQLISRIDTLSATTRSTWFSLLGYLSFVVVTLLTVRDADFFIEARQTSLPIVNVAIPTASFFIMAPLLGTALFVYFHLNLIRLWDALARPPAKIDNEALSRHVAPWLVNDFGLRLRRDDAFEGRTFYWLSHGVTLALVFLAAPLVMFGFWIRHWPAHAFGQSLFLAGLALICTATAGVSLMTALRRLRWKTEYRRDRIHPLRIASLGVFAVCLVALTFFKTEGISPGPDRQSFYWERVNSYALTIGPKRPIPKRTKLPKLLNPLWATATRSEAKRPFWAWLFRTDGRPLLALSSARLTNADLAQRPAAFLDHHEHNARYWISYCRFENIPVHACGTEPGMVNHPTAHMIAARREWAQGFGDVYADDPEASAFFHAFAARFELAWKQERRTTIDRVERIDLRGADLRHARAHSLFLANADLSFARLDHADFSDAQLDGASLFRISARGASFFRSKLALSDMNQSILAHAEFDLADMALVSVEAANAIGASFDTAILINAAASGTFFTSASLRQTDLSDSIFTEAWFDDADIIGTLAYGTDFSGANLTSADLSGSQLHGASLRDASLRDTNLTDTEFRDTDLHQTDVTGSNIEDALIAGTDLSEAMVRH